MLGFRLAFDSWRLAATKSELLPRRPAIPKLELRLAPFLGIEDTALSCFPIQDLAKKMLAKNEARL